MAKKIIFSGIQPSGKLHIGNYLGAIKQWVELQKEDYELIFCIVDLHAVTVKQDPKELRMKSREVAALYIASGIDPQKSKIFIQSDNPDHPYLGWIFSCVTPIGWLERMTQFKDKKKRIGSQSENVSAGLFSYPALMAADILLYDTDLVPVGEDQAQHIEFTVDVAKRFNNLFGETFKVPKGHFNKNTLRIMSLQDPLSKMSKSDIDPKGTLNLLDSPADIEHKIKGAVTDSSGAISLSNVTPALSSLATIYAGTAPQPMTKEDVIKQYEGKGYVELKTNLVKQSLATIQPIQSEYKKVMDDSKKLDAMLEEGASFARDRSSKKLKEVKEKMGLS